MTPGPTISSLAPTTPSAGARWLALDGIRCFAVLGVLVAHFASAVLPGPWGDWGVKVFFVLSGFLITHGLLAARERIATRPAIRNAELRDFFFRRIVRLWPLYFLVLLVTWIFHIEQARVLLPWNLTFTTNYYITAQHTWPGVFSHLWTLAVEQQFYLFWPFLLLFTPPRFTAVTLVALIVLAPFFRASELSSIARLAFKGDTPAGLLLPMCADFLAWGAALAFLLHSKPTEVRRYAFAAGPLAILIFILLYLFSPLGAERFSSPHLAAFSGSALAFAATLLIAHCTCAENSLLSRALRFRPFVYLGMISYGIYIIHNFTYWLGAGLLRRIYGQGHFECTPVQIIYLTILTVTLAAFSWHFFERPLMQLAKSRLMHK